MINTDKITKKDLEALREHLKFLCKMMDEKYNVKDEYRSYSGYLTEKELHKIITSNSHSHIVKWMLSFIWGYSPKKKMFYWIEIKPFSLMLDEKGVIPYFFEKREEIK